ncbi:MAG: S8 family serine peptidase [Bdellovibrionales bacterium]|nr:S8 family serine peptidase [Bdellovibrionales bacterium]
MAPGSDGSNGILSTVPAAKSASLMASKISKSGISYPIHGTSMATPVVSGAAALVYALVRSRGYRPTPAQIEMALIKSAEVKTGLATFVKGGRNLNLKALVSFIDQDMGLSINSETSRNLAAGKVSIHAQPTDQTALVGGKVTFEVATTAESSVFKLSMV